MTPSMQKDIGNYVHVENGGAVSAAFDSGTYASTVSQSGTGIVIDRNGLPKRFLSCKVAIPFRTDNASGKGFSVIPKLFESSASASGFAAAATGSAKTVNNGTTATSVVTDSIAALSVALGGLKRFIRVKWTHHGSANTATGSTLTVGAPVVVFGGADATPASAT